MLSLIETNIEACVSYKAGEIERTKQQQTDSSMEACSSKKSVAEVVSTSQQDTQSMLNYTKAAEIEAAEIKAAEIKAAKIDAAIRFARQQEGLKQAREEERQRTEAILQMRENEKKEAIEYAASVIEEKKKNKKQDLDKNRVHQETRLYSQPQVFEKYDERGKQCNNRLIFMVTTLSQKINFIDIISWLLPTEAACMLQTHKLFAPLIEAVAEQLVNYIHATNFSQIPMRMELGFARGGGGKSGCKSGSFSWTRYWYMLHSYNTDKTNKTDKIDEILLIGGYGGCANSSNKVTKMVIEKIKRTKVIDETEEVEEIEELEVTWEECPSMVKKQYQQPGYYSKGLVVTGSSNDGITTEDDGMLVCYDTVSNISYVLNYEPIHHFLFALAEFNGKPYLLGGICRFWYPSMRTRRSNSVFCYEKDLGRWIEQEAKLITARHSAAAITYQDKLWLAGGAAGDDRHGFLLSSVEVFDPDVGLWQPAGNLTFIKETIKLFVINGELFAAGVNFNSIAVEKYNVDTGVWELVSSCHDGNRSDCGLAACDSTIYFLGGGHGENTFKTWNSFDTSTNTWSIVKKNILIVDTCRLLPSQFSKGQAVCITQDYNFTWTSFKF